MGADKSLGAVAEGFFVYEMREGIEDCNQAHHRSYYLVHLLCTTNIPAFMNFTVFVREM
jgi:hypothetical protein